MAASILARENRIMIKAIGNDVSDIKIDMKNIANHYSKRLPVTVVIAITLLSSLCTGLIVGALT